MKPKVLASAAAFEVSWITLITVYQFILSTWN
jgi:hypothetical protein